MSNSFQRFQTNKQIEKSVNMIPRPLIPSQVPRTLSRLAFRESPNNIEYLNAGMLSNLTQQHGLSSITSGSLKVSAAPLKLNVPSSLYSKSPNLHSNSTQFIFKKEANLNKSPSTNIEDNPRLTSFQRLRKGRVNALKPTISVRSNTPPNRPTSSHTSRNRFNLANRPSTPAINEANSINGNNLTGTGTTENLGRRARAAVFRSSGAIFENLEKKYSKSELKDYYQLFKMFDTDNSGAIGNEELKEAIMRIGLQANDDEINALIEEVDEDGNGEIDFEEFCHCMKKSQNLVRTTNEEIIRQCFEVFDLDENGLITQNEFVYIAKEIGGFEQSFAEYIFGEIDISSNGHLSMEQFATIVEDYLLTENSTSSVKST